MQPSQLAARYLTLLERSAPAGKRDGVCFLRGSLRKPNDALVTRVSMEMPVSSKCVQGLVTFFICTMLKVCAVNVVLERLVARAVIVQWGNVTVRQSITVDPETSVSTSMLLHPSMTQQRAT